MGKKVSEKSLELNIGAELLGLMRGPWGMPKAYLRGLTQREENDEGADAIAELPAGTRLFAFQFKAPKASKERQEGEPYRFTIRRPQHEKLAALAGPSAGNVFYVLPYYLRPAKLQRYVPNLLLDTWFLPVGAMRGTDLFGQFETRTVRCERGLASINPDYALRRAEELEPGEGIPAETFSNWYEDLHAQTIKKEIRGERKDPWLVRGLRVVIVQPSGERER